MANTKALINCAVILFVGVDWYHLSNVMRKPAFAYAKKERRRTVVR